jgi:hypothetical protein
MHTGICFPILHFLRIASSGQRRYCAPGFALFVDAILTGPRGDGQSEHTNRSREFRTIDSPMTRFSALVAIALFGWIFGPECL